MTGVTVRGSFALLSSLAFTPSTKGPTVRDLTISEKLLLLLTKDDGRTVSSSAAYGYAAANIADLALAGRLTLSGDKDPRVNVVDATPTGHPVLDAAVERLADKNGKKFSGLVTDVKVAATPRIVQSLAQIGIIDVEEKKLLGLVPEKHPVHDPAPERALRDQIRLALAGGSAKPKVSTLLSILSGLDVAHKVLADESAGMSKRDLKRRIDEVAVAMDTKDTAVAVKRAIDSMNAVIIASLAASTVTAVSN